MIVSTRYERTLCSILRSGPSLATISLGSQSFPFFYLSFSFLPRHPFTRIPILKGEIETLDVLEHGERRAISRISLVRLNFSINRIAIASTKITRLFSKVYYDERHVPFSILFGKSFYNTEQSLGNNVEYWRSNRFDKSQRKD